MCKQALSSFLAWLVGKKSRTENTIAAYRNDLDQFLDFLASNAIAEAWTSVTEGDTRVCREALKAREYAPTTVARPAVHRGPGRRSCSAGGYRCTGAAITRAACPPGAPQLLG